MAEMWLRWFCKLSHLFPERCSPSRSTCTGEESGMGARIMAEMIVQIYTATLALQKHMPLMPLGLEGQ